MKEVNIIVSLNYSNIIKYFFSINSKNNESRQIIEEYDTNKELYLRMELMQTSLIYILKEIN